MLTCPMARCRNRTCVHWYVICCGERAIHGLVMELVVADATRAGGGGGESDFSASEVLEVLRWRIAPDKRNREHQNENDEA